MKKEMEATPILHKVKQAYRSHGIIESNVNVFGLRDNTNWRKDLFNDYIGVWSKNKLFIYQATTDPGRHYTDNPLNPKGTAHLVLGFHKNIWMIGKHRNKYEALVQWGSKVTVWRDKNKDFKKNKDEIIETGWFGINCHTDLDNNDFIDYASAGCQVIKDSDLFFNEFMPFIKKNLGKQKYISYLLLDRKEMDITL